MGISERKALMSDQTQQRTWHIMEAECDRILPELGEETGKIKNRL